MTLKEVLPDILKLVALVSAIAGAGGGSYYLADQRVSEVSATRQQEVLGRDQLVGELGRRLTRLEDQIDRVERRLDRRARREALKLSHP